MSDNDNFPATGLKKLSMPTHLAVLAAPHSLVSSKIWVSVYD